MKKNTPFPHYDFFIAHAGAEAHFAEALYAKLTDHACIFLDSISLIPGDNWDTELPNAQRQSLITVVLVSSATEAAFYQREEIAAAITMARDNPKTHRVIPVYLDELENDQIPYGLRLKHSIYLGGNVTLETVADRLIDTVAKLKQLPGVGVEDNNSNTNDYTELQSYREQLMDHVRHVDLFHLKHLTGNAPFPIDQIYVPLKVNPRKLHSGLSVLDALHDEKLRYLSPEKREPRELGEILSTLFELPQYRCMIVLGKPGSGKTTLLKYLAYYFASGRQQEIPPGFVERIPFYVRLKDIKEAVSAHPAAGDRNSDNIQQQDPLNLAHAVINNLEVRGYRPLPSVNTVEVWLSNNALVLLDGLDEVADPGQRYQVAQWVKRQMKTYQHAHFIISCRLHGYSVDYVPDVSLTVEVDDFSADLRYQFLQCWFAHVHQDRCARREPPAWQAKTVAHELAETIEQDSNRHLQDLAKNPLLLSMIAIVQLALLNQEPPDKIITLPSVRAQLYDHCVALFIKEWQSNWDLARQVADCISVDEPTGVTASAIKEDTYRLILQRAALYLQAHQNEGDAESAHSVENELLSHLAADLEEATVKQCLHHSHERTLLLVEYAPGQWGFQHKTFQEYLAADAVIHALQERVVDSIPLQTFIDHLGQDHWRVVFELFVEKLQSTHHALIDVFLRACVQRILDDVSLAAQAWDWIEALHDKKDFPFPETEYYRLKHAVWQLLAASEDPIALCKFQHFAARGLPATQPNSRCFRERLDAVIANPLQGIHHVLLLPEVVAEPDSALISQLIGYLDIEEPTPFSAAVALTLKRYNCGDRNRLDCHLFVSMSADEFYRGSLENDEGIYGNEIDGSAYYLAEFQMARYLVTNAQYQGFIDAMDHRTQYGWDAGQYPNGLGQHPVVNVSWHDSQAYIAWLNQQQDGYIYSLPTEAQWERAAHGSAHINGAENRRRYPWGDVFDNARCNTQETGLCHTTAVGCFPQGASLEGVQDMSGNVWEWCADCYAFDYYQHHTVEENKTKGNGWKVLRGGAFYYGSQYARSTVRTGNASVDVSRSIGFRVVRVDA